MCALSILILVSLPFVFIFSLIFFNYLFFRTIQPVVLDTNYINLKNQIIKAERRVLKELGFCVHVKHPHKVINWWIWLYRKFIELKGKKHVLFVIGINIVKKYVDVCIFFYLFSRSSLCTWSGWNWTVTESFYKCLGKLKCFINII